jgi:hypothetical protein
VDAQQKMSPCNCFYPTPTPNPLSNFLNYEDMLIVPLAFSVSSYSFLPSYFYSSSHFLQLKILSTVSVCNKVLRSLKLIMLKLKLPFCIQAL